MSRLVARILLSILMFPLAGVIYLVIFALCIRWVETSQMGWRTRTMVAFSLCGFVTWGFMAVYWFALWRGSTMWTAKRATNTVMMAAAAMVAALLVGTITGEGLSN